MAATGRQKRVRPSYWPEGVDSELEMKLYERLERAGLPLGVPQHRGIPDRLYRFDRAWPSFNLAVDVHGATFVKGGHSTGKGIEKDCEKACLAAVYGWRYLPVTKHMIDDGRAIDLIRRALEAAEQ